MDNMAPSKPSFYRILNYITTKLEVPVGFTMKQREILYEGSACKLRIASGATWVVGVEQLEKECYYFTRGWTAFCRDMELHLFEMLVFSYEGDSTFHVVVYAVTGMEKKSNFLVFVDQTEESEPEPEFEAHSCTSVNPRFKVVLTPSYIYTLNVPLRFAEVCGLVRQERVRLGYGESSVLAEVKMVSRICQGRRVVRLSKGWNKFRMANRMCVGKAYEFEFSKPHNLFRVHPLHLTTRFNQSRS